jgi:hypothetical protein
MALLLGGGFRANANESQVWFVLWMTWSHSTKPTKATVLLKTMFIL